MPPMSPNMMGMGQQPMMGMPQQPMMDPSMMGMPQQPMMDPSMMGMPQQQPMMNQMSPSMAPTMEQPANLQAGLANFM